MCGCVGCLAYQRDVSSWEKDNTIPKEEAKAKTNVSKYNNPDSNELDGRK